MNRGPFGFGSAPRVVEAPEWAQRRDRPFAEDRRGRRDSPGGGYETGCFQARRRSFRLGAGSAPDYLSP